uniref:Uncharacterized protein n=2 Tax=Sus scrofa TaxID=9823 RepID=A0A4X1T6R0_PIG
CLRCPFCPISSWTCLCLDAPCSNCTFRLQRGLKIPGQRLSTNGESLDGRQIHVDHAASRPGEQEGVHLRPMVTATLEVEGTRAMEVADMTVYLEDMAMAMDMEGPETMAAARVVMTAIQEEITGTIMTIHRNKTSDPGPSSQMAKFLKIFVYVIFLILEEKNILLCLM